jgi:hypothetical protein
MLEVQNDETAPSPDMLSGTKLLLDKGATLTSHDEYLFRAMFGAQSGRAFTRRSHQGTKRGILENLLLLRHLHGRKRAFWAQHQICDEETRCTSTRTLEQQFSAISLAQHCLWVRLASLNLLLLLLSICAIHSCYPNC